MANYRRIIDNLASGVRVDGAALAELIGPAEAQVREYAAGLAREVAEQHFGRGVFLRGLVEISNRCSRGCYYCGLRAENDAVRRYALEEEEIVAACEEGYELGFRSFVLQGGELHNIEQGIAHLTRRLKSTMADAALTLSLGEQSEATYRAWREAGADRYLLRHETASPDHYAMLHPSWMSYESRLECLEVLHRLGYQRGAGFMVGSPGQTVHHLAQEIEFLGRLRPEMVGIGPFVPQSATPFAKQERGSVERTLLMISLVRLTLPKALIPATTALASSDEAGTVRGVLAGANVVMPNITPARVRGDYAIYDGKKSFGSESGEGVALLTEELARVGYEARMTRGDHPDYE